MRRGRLPALADVASLAAAPGAAAQGTPYPGCYLGEVIRVIVAPEARGPACEAERVFGTMAPRRLAELLPVGTEVRITDLRADTFAGRVVAEAERLVDTNCRCLRIELLALRVAPVGAVDALRRRAAGH